MSEREPNKSGMSSIHNISHQLNENTPEGWSISTTATHHISLYHDSGRSIAMNETRGEWTVTGLCQYGAEDHPRFALEAVPEEAVEAAIEAMEAVSTGDPEAAEIVARASDIDAPSTAGIGTDIQSGAAEDSPPGDATDNDSNDDTDDEGDSQTGQASLTEF